MFINYRCPQFVLLLFSLAMVSPVWAGGSSENLVLVVNARSAASLAVANHYIQLRDIPRRNVIYLKDIPDREMMQVNFFASKILKPVLKAIDDRKLSDHVNLIVYSADFPSAFVNKTHQETLREKMGGRLPPKRFNAIASINSLTYFYTSVLANDPSYMLLDANWYVRRNSKQMLAKPFLGEDQKQFDLALFNFKQDDFEKAAELLRQLADKHPGQVAARYQLVRALAAADKKEEAIAELAKAVSVGWRYRSFTEQDPILSTIAGEQKFKQVTAQMADDQFAYLPTRAFHNRVAWGPNGWPNQTRDQGKRLMLSTMLAVTRNRGTSLDEALRHLSASVAADGTRPRGQFLFVSHRDIRSKTRQSQFDRTIAALRELGLESEIGRKPFPANHPRMLGLTSGTATAKWQNANSRFVPGAIADNLTSFGGVMRPNGSQTPLTDFLKLGAAGASGTVTEPLADPAKFPNAMIHAHYARGCSLAEAFYQSVAGPFQLLIVGDPLCRPWAKFPVFEISGISDGDVVKDTFRLSLNPLPSGAAISRFEMYLDGVKGKNVAPDATLNIDTSNMSDGYHEIRIVAVDRTIIETRASKRIGFVVNNQDKRVVLKIRGENKVGLDQSLTFTFETNVGQQIEFMQNSRRVAVRKRGQGPVKIAAKLLGQGTTSVRAVVQDGQHLIASQPVIVEITDSSQ